MRGRPRVAAEAGEACTPPPAKEPGGPVAQIPERTAWASAARLDLDASAGRVPLPSLND